MATDRVALVRPGGELAGAGEWVVFVGADGPPSGRDLSRIDAATQASAVLVVAARGRGRTGEIDLESEPDGLPLNGSVFAFRTATLREHGLTMDPDQAPDLAGPLLVAEYLTAAPRPLISVVRSTADRSIPIDWENSSRYTVEPQRYVSFLDRQKGPTPVWLQRLVLHQFLGYLREDARLFSPVAALGPALVDALHRSLTAVLAHLDDDTIREFVAEGVTDEMRLALLLGAQHRPGHGPPTARRDGGRALTRWSYLYAGEPPAETLTVDGAPVAAEHDKRRTVMILGRPLLTERILWTPERAVLTVDPRDGVALPPSAPPSRLARVRRVVAENSGVAGRVVADLRLRRRARRPDEVERYHEAWLLMDRDSAAQDNAEHLYRHLLAHEPKVNAWFVLARDSPDWERLQRDGFRMLAFGSDEYFVALLNCAHLVSSQVDDYVVKPFRKHLLGPPRWRYSFLQHGVILHDLSRWLNRKAIDLLVTTTPDEQRSIVADGTPYVLTDLESKMIGLARHDRLLQVAERAERDWLLVMPTWRAELLREQVLGNERGLLDGFWDTAYARSWRELLESDRLRALCERKGWQLTFVPHPNMQDSLDSSPLPAHVKAFRFSEVDVQTVLARGAAFVTDYSSLAMEAAYLTRPVVYYQFDREAFYRGRLYQAGEWSFERQGFGPVGLTPEDIIDALERIADDGGPAPEYAARMQNTFPLRDGHCCERTVAAIRAITAR